MIFASDATTRSDRFVLHHKDELDAAEALANLAFNCRQRWHQTISSWATPPKNPQQTPSFQQKF